ncbi:MAG TPA: cupredoxin domain-containing protein [Acidimicrobiia bacterium]
MRKVSVVMALFVVVLGAFMVGTAGAGSKKPVTLDGAVNAHGSKDVSKKSSASLEIEMYDFYLEPTYVKVKPGEKLTLALKNSGKAQHTFTSDALGVDKQLAPGQSMKIKVTIPSSGGTTQFHCRFHESMGMQGAFYTKVGVTASNTPTTKSSSSSGSGY